MHKYHASLRTKGNTTVTIAGAIAVGHEKRNRNENNLGGMLQYSTM